MNDPRLLKQVETHPYPLLFATISGAHLYGFPSPDSDFDLRGAHLLPLKDVIGLKEGQETVERSGIHDGLEIDLVTHDIKKFMGLMLKKNGYVLEQLLSPLIVHTTPEHEELKAIGPKCITRYHAYHYLGFVETQWKLFQKADPPHVKPLLYVYRVLLTGIHLMLTGEVEASLPKLNEEFRLPYIPELIERKTKGPEKGTLQQADLGFHQREFERLRTKLEEAMKVSQLPESPSGNEALNDLLVRLRLGDMEGLMVSRRTKYGIVFTLLGIVLLGFSFDQRLVPAVLLAWCGVCFVILGAAYFTNNAAIFGKQLDGTLRWPESLLMMPYLLLAAVVWRLQNLFTDKCPWSGVAPNLYVGRRCSLTQLPPNTSGVIDVTAEFPTPRTLRQQSRVLVVPTLDGGAPSWSQCQQVVDFVRTDPTGVFYVYCANGAGRSVTYVAILLGLKGLASSASEAIDSIRKARKVAAPNTDQRRFIEEVFKTQILQNGQTISSEVG